MGTNQDREYILVWVVGRRIDGMVVMNGYDLICKSCVADAGLYLSMAYTWYGDILDVTELVEDASCIVCKDKECGPWTHIKYLGVDPSFGG